MDMHMGENACEGGGRGHGDAPGAKEYQHLPAKPQKQEERQATGFPSQSFEGISSVDTLIYDFQPSEL